ncbi:MAG: tetratricopeptide repeat protein [Methanosarcinales archaeon]
MQLHSRHYDALQSYQKALLVVDELGLNNLSIDDQQLVASAYCTMGDIYQDFGNFVDAERYYKTSLDLANKLKDRITIANSRRGLGQIYDVKGEFEESLKHYQNALDIGKQLNNNFLISRLYNHIGYIYQVWNRFDKALEYYKKALDAAKQASIDFAFFENICNSGNLLTYPQIAVCQSFSANYNDIALVWQYKGDLKEAVRYYQYL